MPWDLLEAIGQAHRVLDWHENLSPEEIPPEWMWSHPDALNEWFDDVKANRDVGGGSDDDDEIVPMTKNEDPRMLSLKRR